MPTRRRKRLNKKKPGKPGISSKLQRRLRREQRSRRLEEQRRGNVATLQRRQRVRRIIPPAQPEPTREEREQMAGEAFGRLLQGITGRDPGLTSDPLPQRAPEREEAPELPSQPQIRAPRPRRARERGEVSELPSQPQIRAPQPRRVHGRVVPPPPPVVPLVIEQEAPAVEAQPLYLSLIHISEPTRPY